VKVVVGRTAWFNISMVLFYRFHAPFFFYCAKFCTVANSRRPLYISAKGQLKKVVKFSPEKHALW
jgi:hypothetical protein